MKRFFDFFLAVAMLIFLCVPMLAIAFIVLVSMGSPVLFKQVRPGFKSKPFRIMKFRTMNDDRDQEVKLLPDQKRLTKTGRVLRKFSLDELPQLFNVLKGDLSFVGPRPLLTEYLPRYTPEQARRHDVRPGITGWAQINGRNAISWEEKFNHDVWYVDNRNFMLDLKILWMTFLKVLKKEGVTAEGYATMPEFTGTDRDGK
jgi:sugar transferase EpsL